MQVIYSFGRCWGLLVLRYAELECESDYLFVCMVVSVGFLEFYVVLIYDSYLVLIRIFNNDCFLSYIVCVEVF